MRLRPASHVMLRALRNTWHTGAAARDAMLCRLRCSRLYPLHFNLLHFFFRFHIQHSPFHASRSALYTLHFKALHRPPTAPHFKLRLPLSTLPPHFTPRASHSKPYLPCSLPPRSTIHAQLATLPAQHSTLPIPHFSLHALRSTRPASHSTFCTPRSHSTRHASRPHFILRALGSTRTPRAPHSALRALRSALHP